MDDPFPEINVQRCADRGEVASGFVPPGSPALDLGHGIAACTGTRTSDSNPALCWMYRTMPKPSSGGFELVAWLKRLHGELPQPN